jgi:hypothetical protein
MDVFYLLGAAAVAYVFGAGGVEEAKDKAAALVSGDKADKVKKDRGPKDKEKDASPPKDAAPAKERAKWDKDGKPLSGDEEDEEDEDEEEPQKKPRYKLQEPYKKKPRYGLQEPYKKKPYRTVEHGVQRRVDSTMDLGDTAFNGAFSNPLFSISGGYSQTRTVTTAQAKGAGKTKEQLAKEIMAPGYVNALKRLTNERIEAEKQKDMQSAIAWGKKEVELRNEWARVQASLKTVPSNAGALTFKTGPIVTPPPKRKATVFGSITPNTAETDRLKKELEDLKNAMAAKAAAEAAAAKVAAENAEIEAAAAKAKAKIKPPVQYDEEEEEEEVEDPEEDFSDFDDGEFGLSGDKKHGGKDCDCEECSVSGAEDEEPLEGAEDEEEPLEGAEDEEDDLDGEEEEDDLDGPDPDEVESELGDADEEDESVTASGCASGRCGWAK